MNTTGTDRRRRRRHDEQFKAEAVAACRQPGVSMASVALARGLNANLLRRWVVEAESSAAADGMTATKVLPDAIEAPSFVPVPMKASPAAEASIRIEVRRGSTAVTMQWPPSAARECAVLLRKILR